MPFRVRFDSPVTLWFVGLALAATLMPGGNGLLRLDPIGPVNLMNPRWYLGVIGHVFAHQNLVHLVGNAGMFLLLAPGLERKLGSGRFLLILTALVVLTGLSASLILVFSQSSLIGASGLVFALIFLHSMQGTKKYEIPMTVVLLALLWGSKEVVGMFDQSRISNTAHLNGAVWGFLFGVSRVTVSSGSG